MFYSNFVPKTHCFWNIRLWKMSWPWSPGQRSLKVVGTDTNRSATYDFLLMSHSNHLPVRHRLRDKRRFQSQIANFSHTRVFCAPAEGLPLELGIGTWSQKTRAMGLPGRTRSLTISSAMWIQSTNVTDRQTERRTDIGRQQRPALTHSVARVKIGKKITKTWKLLKKISAV